MKCPKCGSEMKTELGDMIAGSDEGKIGGGLAGIAAGFLIGGPVGAAVGLALGSRAGQKLSTMHHICPKCGHIVR